MSATYANIQTKRSEAGRARRRRLGLALTLVAAVAVGSIAAASLATTVIAPTRTSPSIRVDTPLTRADAESVERARAARVDRSIAPSPGNWDFVGDQPMFARPPSSAFPAAPARTSLDLEMGLTVPPPTLARTTLDLEMGLAPGR